MRLKIKRGDDVPLPFAVARRDGTIPNLTGASIWFTAKNSKNDVDASAVCQYTVGSGIVVDNAVGGLLTVTINKTHTATLGEDTVLVFDLQVKDAAGKVATVADGTILIEADVTRAT